MKETHHIFCAILLLFCLFGVEHVQSVCVDFFVFFYENENWFYTITQDCDSMFSGSFFSFSSE